MSPDTCKECFHPASVHGDRALVACAPSSPTKWRERGNGTLVALYNSQDSVVRCLCPGFRNG